MDAIGAKLSGAREAKGVSIEQAARDTHIAKRFIEALEREDFDLFPGEVYLLGFIRSYSGYLGLNSEDIISLYHNIRLQEQPAPIDELLDRRPRREGMKFVIIGIAALLIVGAIVLLSASGIVSLRRAATEEPVENPTMEALVLNEQFVERRFVEGSRVAVPLDGEQVLLEFVSIGERVAVGSDAGIVQLDVGEERMLDITGEGSGDVSLVIRQIYGEEMPPAVVARVDRIVVAQQPVSNVQPLAELTEAERTELALGRTAEPSREREPVVVAQFDAPQEYFIEADFRGLTMFRWEIDDLPQEERYLQNGDRVRTGVQDTARIWTSNAGNVRMRVAGNPIELGRQGEIVAVMLRWNAAADGGFQLELLPLY